MRRKLQREDGAIVIQVAPIDNPAESGRKVDDTLLKRWKGTLTKLRVFGLKKFSKVVYLDADTLVLKNTDDLFSLDAPIGVVMECCDKFNAGMMVLTPE